MLLLWSSLVSPGAGVVAGQGTGTNSMASLSPDGVLLPAGNLWTMVVLMIAVGIIAVRGLQGSCPRWCAAHSKRVLLARTW